MVGSAHRKASDTNEGQHSQQQQFGCVVHQAVKDIRIYWTPGDHRTPALPLLRLSVRFQTALKLPLVNIVRAWTACESVQNLQIVARPSHLTHLERTFAMGFWKASGS
jgi:hypothetical protein